MIHPRYKNWRVWRESGKDLTCTLEIPMKGACIIVFLRLSIILSMNHLQVFVVRYLLSFMGMDLTIQDNGRGIPVDIHPKHNIPALELVLTNLHAGGKFGKGAYQVSGGLHGVGAKCVNAVSEWFEAEVRKDGKIHQMSFSQGITTKKLAVIGETKKTGTKISFKPDPVIFLETRTFHYDILAKRLRELAFLNPGIHITISDERSSKSENFQ